MCKKSAFLTVAVVLWCFTACVQRNKSVEYPLIESANTMTLDISKIEQTDTATVLYVEANSRPRSFIEISSDVYLQADGKKYALIETPETPVDSRVLVSETGEAFFVFFFEPLPKKARSFDFIDPNFKLYGVDLTGEKKFGPPAGTPSSVCRNTETAPDPLPAPIFKVGETVLHIHLPNDQRESIKKVELYLNTLMNSQQSYTSAVDPETGTVEFRFWQYGIAFAVINLGDMGFGETWLAPGEEVDIYVNSSWSGQMLMARRVMTKNLPLFDLVPLCYSSGTYAGLIPVSLRWKPGYSLNLFNGKFADYRMSAAEYTQYVINSFQALSDSVARSDLSPVAKEMEMLKLKQEAVMAIALGDNIRERNYRTVKNQWDYSKPLDVKIDPLTAENRAELCKLFPVVDPMLLMGDDITGYVVALTDPDIEWPEEAGLEGSFASDLRLALPLVKKASNAALTDDDLKSLDNLQDPFYREALLKMQENVEALLKLNEKESVIEKTPEVALEQLFDAIIAPYKGKVVLVDFWNTWCGPCRSAIKANEPLKDNELKSDDLVWVYIANETSPLDAYMEMIPGIRGKHYRLNQEQWDYIGKKFGLDGIPSYVLVDKSGHYELRNDLRSPYRMEPELKKMINGGK